MRTRRLALLHRAKATFRKVRNLGENIRLTTPKDIISTSGEGADRITVHQKHGKKRGSGEEIVKRNPTFADESTGLGKYFRSHLRDSTGASSEFPVAAGN